MLSRKEGKGKLWESFYSLCRYEFVCVIFLAKQHWIYCLFTSLVAWQKTKQKTAFYGDYVFIDKTGVTTHMIMKGSQNNGEWLRP